MGWVDKTSNTYWTGDANISWVTDHWAYVNTMNVALLSPTGGWETDHRPTHVRLTFAGAGIYDVKLVGYDDSHAYGGTIVNFGEGDSGVSKEISYINDGDIWLFYIQISGSWNITKIEFYEEPVGWSHNFMGVANANIAKINGVAIANIKSVNEVE